MSMQAYYLVFYPLPEKFWELLKPSYKKVLTSPVSELFVSLLTDKHQFMGRTCFLFNRLQRSDERKLLVYGKSFEWEIKLRMSG